MLADILKEVRFALNDKGVRKKQCIEVAFWCHGGKQRSVAAARFAQFVFRLMHQPRMTEIIISWVSTKNIDYVT
jgi:RNase adaptor protein for sRNA GlmZ degradation